MRAPGGSARTAGSALESPAALARLTGQEGADRVNRALPGAAPVTCGRDWRIMKSTLIIEASDSLAWHHRLVSTASTAALWGGWLWLWAPLVKAAGQLAQLGLQMPAWGLQVLPAGAPSLPLSLAAIAGTSGTLVAWRKLPRRRAKVESALPVSEYALRLRPAGAGHRGWPTGHRERGAPPSGRAHRAHRVPRRPVRDPRPFARFPPGRGAAPLTARGSPRPRT